jgi:nucleotide-binding universal stress UspA family protein
MPTPPIRSILVATDLTEASDEVLRAGAAIAALTGAALHVVNALEIPATPYLDAFPLGADFDGWIRSAERELREQFARAVPERVEPASLHVVIYAAPLAILDRATEIEADLIVVGPHRRRAVGDRFLGTTSDRVLRSVSVPVLVVRAPLPMPLRRVRVPVDLSEPGRGALDAALGWTRDFGAGHDGADSELAVLHVVPKAFEAPDFAFDREVIAPELSREVEAARERTGIVPAGELREAVVWGDDAARAVLEHAERERVGLIVMGTHGYGFVRRLVIGSVASAVVREAPCSVLLIPPPRGATGGAATATSTTQEGAT